MKKLFDIGAHRGLYSYVALEKGYEVIAVEANPEMIPQINELIMNPHFQVINKMISDVYGDQSRFYVHEKTELSTASLKWRDEGRFNDGSLGEYEKEIIVETITLDSMIESYGVPDVIKVDVEGYENVALRGLSTKVNTLCFEWQNSLRDELKECFEKCAELGYTNFGNVDQTYEKGNSELYFVQPNTWTSDYNDILKEIDEDECKVSWGMIWCR